MDIRPLTPGLAVSPQISAADVPAIAALGYKTLVCHRPDGEAPDQPPCAQIEQAARAAGMSFHYQPYSPGMAIDPVVDAFAAVLGQSTDPVLAYCRTGTRCTTLWALGAAATTDMDTILSAAATAGYDLSGLRPQLAARQVG